MDTNFTPLDSNRLKNLYRVTSAEISSPQKKGLHLPNVFLTLSIVGFVFSISYAIYANQLSYRSRADESKETPLYPVFPAKKTISTITDYPTSYKDKTIPQSIYEDVKKNYTVDTTGSKNYVIDTLIRYYTYQDVITEADLDYTESTQEGEFAKVIDDVKTMTDILKENITKTEYKSLDEIVTTKINNFK